MCNATHHKSCPSPKCDLSDNKCFLDSLNASPLRSNAAASVHTSRGILAISSCNSILASQLFKFVMPSPANRSGWGTYKPDLLVLTTRVGAIAAAGGVGTTGAICPSASDKVRLSQAPCASCSSLNSIGADHQPRADRRAKQCGVTMNCTMPKNECVEQGASVLGSLARLVTGALYILSLGCVATERGADAQGLIALLAGVTGRRIAARRSVRPAL